MKCRAVIFDLDGTLLDTLEDLADATNAALAVKGFPVHPLESYRYFVGSGAHVLCEMVLPAEYRTPENVSALARELQVQYAPRQFNKTCPYDGIADLLAFLEARKIPKAVLSNKPHAATVPIIDHYFSSFTFAAVFGARDGISRKPAPDAAREIAQLMHLECSDIMFMGDTDIDIKTGCAAGMFPAGVLWGFRTADELTKAGASALFTSPKDAYDFFG